MSMRAKTIRGPLAAVLGGLCAVAISCGGSNSKLLAGDDAGALKTTLASVQDAVDARDCAATDARLEQLGSELRNLPKTISPRLRSRLRREVEDDLAPRARFECGKPKQETVPTTTEPAPTGPTGPQDKPKKEKPTPTEPPPTGPTAVEPPTETVPPEDPSVPADPVPPGAAPGDQGDPGGFGPGQG